ncbi:MAG TPA: hypothetical protein VJT83_04110 [Chitinophagaceae bacterium]|nr:hypothetical protein [Chitinophagaceae bacterium]
MSKRLEQFIQENREAFDSEEPRSQLWRKLQDDLNNNSKDDRVFHLSFLRWTAAAAVLIMLGGMFYYMQKQSTNNLAVNNSATEQTLTPDQMMNELDPTYTKQVYHFTQLIELKQSELKQIEREQPELYNRFVKDINKMDSSYQALKKELPVNPNRELLLETMIENLRLQTELLNQQLSIIKQLKQKNTKENESISKSI